LQKIADRAFYEIACNPKYSYKEFIERFDYYIEKEFKNRKIAAKPNPYNKNSFLADIFKSKRYITHKIISKFLQKVFLSTGLRKYVFRIWGKMPLSARATVRSKLRILGR
jgi:uncharacterized protein VirK/YbjX